MTASMAPLEVRSRTFASASLIISILSMQKIEQHPSSQGAKSSQGKLHRWYWQQHCPCVPRQVIGVGQHDTLHELPQSQQQQKRPLHDCSAATNSDVPGVSQLRAVARQTHDIQARFTVLPMRHWHPPWCWRQQHVVSRVHPSGRSSVLHEKPL